MNVTRIPCLPEWKEAGVWLNKNYDGHPVYISNLSRATDLYRTKLYARERMLGNLALLKAAGMAHDTPINIAAEIIDLEEKASTPAFREQVQKKFLRLKMTNECPF